MQFHLISLILSIGIVFFSILTADAFAEEYTISIPFGAYNPELNTPAKVWFDPPSMKIKVDDTITWVNDDREGHTITSGLGSGRFGWMDDDYGTPNGIFDSERFMPQESWSYTFEEQGVFRYFCVIHPWMEGVISVEPLIPDYPHDALGNKLEKFPDIRYTADNLVEIDLAWEPPVIKTHDKVTFVFQTYDPATNSNLDKMNYDIIIIQNGKELFRDTGITSVGGDYRNFIFEESGPVEIIFENIISWGSSGIESAARDAPEDPVFRSAKFTTMVYDNPEKFVHDENIVQPEKTFQLYYELAVGIIVVPGVIFVFILWRMKSGKKYHRKSTAI